MLSSPIKNFEKDFEIVHARIELNNAVLTVLHGGMSEILRCDVSQIGALDMKAIAETTLCEVQRIAIANQEVVNA